MDQIHITDAQPSEIIENLTQIEPHEAFYLCDLDDVVRKYETWKKLMPRIEPHYAVKCNPSRPVLEVLAALGTGFDCASMDEIRQIRTLGVHPDRIIFAHPTKLPSHIKYARSEGVSMMTFDCEAELEKMKKCHPEARAVLRIRYDDPKAHYQLGIKFGCDSRTEAPGLLRRAEELGVNVVGVSFHIGSSSHNPSIFREAIKACAAVFKVASSLGVKLSLLDIGGGFLGEKGTSIVVTAGIINQALDDFFPGESGVKIISEPGRFFVSSAFTLLANIHTVKCHFKTVDGHREKRFDYYIDDGVFGSFIAVLCDEKLVGRPLRKKDGVEIYHSTIWGPTCDSFDKVDADIMLPEMDVGDWLIFEDMGAYTLSVSSHFNGFTSPQVHAIITTKIRPLLSSSIPSNRFTTTPVYGRNECSNQQSQIMNGLKPPKTLLISNGH